MRILRLDFGQGQTRLDLHPFVTVARSLSTGQIDELLEVVRSLARGSTAGVRGLVQDQGILVELDGFANDRFLSVTGANVVVDCDAAEAAGLAGLQAQIDQMTRRAEIDAVVVEEIRADLDPSARARVAGIEAQLRPVDEAVVAAEQQQNAAVEAALAAVAAQDPVIYEAPEAVITLRRRWDEHAQRMVGAKEHFASLMNGVTQAETRAAKARQGLELAQQEAKPVLLTRQEESRLEMLSFPEQDESRRGRWRKHLRPEEEDEKRALLAQVGIDSWTAYTLYRTAPVAPPERIQAAETARQVLGDAEASLADVRNRLSSDPLTTELNAEADAIREEARPYLGQLLPADLGQALHGLVVEKTNELWLASLDQLQELAVAYGIPLGTQAGVALIHDPGPSASEACRDLIASAELWLDGRRRDLIDIDRDRVEAELATARRGLERHERAFGRIERAELAAASSSLRLGQLQEQLAIRSQGAPRSAAAVLTLVGPVATQVQLEARGSVPLVVVGEFSDLGDADVCDLMDEFSALAEGLQIVVLSEHPAIGAWADQAGLDKALVTRPKPAEPSAPDRL